MSEADTRRLITALTDQLEPVRRAPRLRVGLAAVALVWLAVSGVVLARGGVSVAALLARFDAPPLLLGVLGLLVAAIGGTLAGLAAGAPGRERLAGGATLACGAGLLLAVAVSLFALIRGAVSEPPLAADAHCFSAGAAMALVPCAVLLGFMLRGFVQRAVHAAGLALLGGFALGAATLHASCAIEGARHALLGHVSIPIVIATIGLLPLTIVLRRYAR